MFSQKESKIDASIAAQLKQRSAMLKEKKEQIKRLKAQAEEIMQQIKTLKKEVAVEQYNINEQSIIEVSTRTNKLPADVSPQERKLMEELLELIQLLSKRFYVESIRAQFNRLKENEISILFNSDRHVWGDVEGQEAIDYLKTHGAIENPSWCYFKPITLSLKQYRAALDDLLKPQVRPGF